MMRDETDESGLDCVIGKSVDVLAVQSRARNSRQAESRYSVSSVGCASKGRRTYSREGCREMFAKFADVEGNCLQLLRLSKRSTRHRDFLVCMATVQQ